MGNRKIAGLAAAVAILLAAGGATPASAAIVIADYNDLSLGLQQTQFGGTGLSGSDDWSGTGTIDVISGDLTAPAGTNYALTQSGPARSVIGDWNQGRRNIRDLAAPLTGNTLWFSFLAQNQSNNSRGGITFNGSGGVPQLSDPRVQTVGADLFVNGGTVATGVFTAGQTALVLGRVAVADSGNDTWDIWVDPDVSGGPGGLGAPTASVVDDRINAAGITRLANVSYHYGGAAAGVQDGTKLDMIYVSDGPDGFADVTGVAAGPPPPPPPPSLLTNGDFEAAPFDDAWTRTGNVGTAETSSPISGTTSLRMSWNTSGTMSQVPEITTSDFEYDFTFQHMGNTVGRTMNTYLFAGSSLGVNARVLVQPQGGEDDILQVYDGSSWQNVSPTGFFSSTTQPYRVSIRGHDWGTAAASYDLLWSTAGATTLSNQSLGLTHFQTSGPTSNEMNQVRFLKPFANANSWLVDDVTLTGSTSTLAAYDFTGRSTASTDGEPLTTATNYATLVGGISTGADNAFVRSTETGSTEAGAVAGDDYHSFMLEIPGGVTVDLEDLVYDYFIQNPYNTYKWTSFVRSSLDGFATTLGGHTFTATSSGGSTSTELVTIDLSGASWNALGGDVEFRLYFYDDSSGSNRIHRMDNFVLHGTASSAPIPEPVTMAALALAVTGLGGYVRKRRSGV